MTADIADTELKDIVTHTLERNGVLSNLRAQLRASVFLALEEQEASKCKTEDVNKPLKEFVSNREGLLVYALVREFLEFFNLEYTLAVLDAESNTKQTILKKDLFDEFSIKSSDGFPLLTEVLHAGKNSKRYNGQISPEAESSYSVVKNEQSNISSLNSSLKHFDYEEKESSSRVNNVSDVSSVDKNILGKTDSNQSSVADSFFDDPIPVDNPPHICKLDDKESKDVQKLEIHKDNEKNLKMLAGSSDSKKEASTNLTNLKELPSLPGIGNKGNDFSTWNLAAIDKRIADLGFEVPDDEEDYDDFSSTSRSKSDKNVYSEQSIEEDIDEELPDISSHSDTDDLTTDKTISQIDDVSGVDYMEYLGTEIQTSNTK